MSGSCESACFSNDNKFLFTEGEECEIYQWDLTSRKLFSRISDEGCVKNTSIEISRNNNLLATGCSSGVVNIYKLSKNAENVYKLENNSKPAKVFL